ncbi:MAG: Fe-S protein assembly co-chaperone HscB [Myxococcales bacterium]|nr:Fe-S protein assembly co-chaperone HscB [Myxococcales bacterium]
MSISRTDLDRAFRTVAKQVHPDRFSRDEPEKRKQALHHTELVNVAYKTLKNSQKRAEYLLELGGFQVASETDRTEDKSFLLRLLEKQELLDEAKDIATIASLKRETTDRQKTLVARVTQFFDANKDNSSLAIVDGVGPENVRKSLVELRYLRRLLDHIAVKEEELF